MRKLSLGITFIIVILDQLTKWLISKNYILGETVTLFPSFDLTLRHNTGAAFSFLAREAGWQRWFFIALAILVCTIITIWLSKVPKEDKLETISLSLILGGALGNLVDRVVHGYVIDFILIYYKQWFWPAFNIADSAICVGVALLIIKIFKKS